ncbi:hypothetical protein B0T14DRAFT_597244 [Immersiella caudata]|uniref:Uncharacterized protein n=1 Tax=Immersiella caudata TaxID=314043 RepID=A0AA40CBU2_9PEZI|nr:hypothetical protein B0T14DRAFT_597244 [Immersiella caudata]
MAIPTPTTMSIPALPPPNQTAPTIFRRPPNPAPLIYINGLPGVGKEALAECLSLLLGREKSILLNLHSINPNLSPPCLTPEHPSYSSPSLSPSLVTLSRVLSHPSNTSRLAILALCLHDTPLGQATILTLRSAALSAGRLFVPISLTCEPAEHLKRANSLQRQCSLHKGTGRPGRSGNVKGERPRVARARGMVTVDITRVSLLEAAVQILEVAREREREVDEIAEIQGQGEVLRC